MGADVKVGFLADPFASVVKGGLFHLDEGAERAGVQGSRDFKLVGQNDPQFGNLGCWVGNYLGLH